MRVTLRRAGAAAALAAILALAAWTRLTSYPSVLGRGEVVPLHDGDSSYHLQRSLATLRDLPRVPHFDPHMNWPKGAFPPWSDGFDLSAALFAAAAGGSSNLERARIAIALWPVVLGVLLVWATWRMTRTAFPGRAGSGAALGAAVMLALSPTGIVTALFGRMDHHVLEALVVVLLTTWALKALPPRPGLRPAGGWRFELEGALVAGLGLYGFTGTPLYVAIAAAVLGWSAIRTGRALGAAGLVGGGLLSALLTVPAVVDHRMLLVFKFPSFLQPLLLVLAGVAVAACAWIAGSSGAGRRRRLVTAGAALGAAAVVLGAVAGRASQEVRSAIQGWLFRQDPWLATVQEFTSLLQRGTPGDGPLDRIHQGFGWAAFFLPVAMALLVAAFGTRPRVRALLVATAVYVALAVLQVRFVRVAAPLVVASDAAAVALLLRALWDRRRWSGGAAWTPLVLLVLTVADGPSRMLLLPGVRSRMEPIIEAAVQLRDVPLPPGAEPGVLTNWSYGHHVGVVASAPVIVNGFGSYLDAPEFWRAAEVFRGSAEGFDAYLREHRVGAVMAGPGTIGAEVTGAGNARSFTAGALNQAYMTSIPLSPLLIAGSAVPGWGVPNLPHLLPRYASSAVVTGLGFPLPFLWTFERVEGARVRGEAAPGARVVGELPFTEWGRPHTYKAFADAGPDGRWEMVLPFPGGYHRSVIRAAPRWSFSAAGGPPRQAEVTEAAVRAGATVEVGRLDPPAP